ncbi:hypothetical protein BGZ60DRAFT_405310 [Tricladium varicosporioides]|nr:hypothetical protein BGZ60DRAFT_405310 [Hymenoscyphus varicosporioides]
MGWLWSDTAPAVPPQNPPQAESPCDIPKPPAPFPSASQPFESIPKVLSRDEQAEKELNSFLAELSASDNEPKKKKYTRMSKSAPLPTSPTQNSLAASQNIPLSEQLLPTSMSCRIAFDEAFYCNSFGGKFNDLYRYGGLRSCSDTWEKFWFCMRTRGYGDKEKGEAIREYYRKVEGRKYPRGVKGRSSEDVWRSRERKVEWGEAFSVEVREFEGSDEEWNRQERERRRNKASRKDPL